MTRKIIKNCNREEKNKEEGDNKFQVVRQVNQPATSARVLYQSPSTVIVIYFWTPIKKIRKKNTNFFLKNQININGESMKKAQKIIKTS
jgi:hypothetical protein